MRKLIIFSLVIPACLLLSFSFQLKPFKKVGTDLYQVVNQKSISAEDKQALMKMIGDHYGLTDFSKQVTITEGSALNAKGGSIISTSTFNRFLIIKILIWRPGPFDAGGDKLRRLVSKYAGGM